MSSKNDRPAVSASSSRTWAAPAALACCLCAPAYACVRAPRFCEIRLVLLRANQRKQTVLNSYHRRSFVGCLCESLCRPGSCLSSAPLGSARSFSCCASRRKSKTAGMLILAFCCIALVMPLMRYASAFVGPLRNPSRSVAVRSSAFTVSVRLPRCPVYACHSRRFPQRNPVS
jgi:hypothetical protein